jgi:YrbI family 3-deoxy-D-manno-octulosonate 8-phosphate phosphatase
MLKNIKLIVYDFDGVMTDNRVITFSDGREAVICNRSDGLAVGIIRNKGIRQLIITTETNKVVLARAKKLDLPILAGINNKKKCLLGYCRRHKIDLKTIVYIGNDTNDLEVMQAVGWPMCPKNAHPRIKEISRIIFSKNGGEGVVRELAYFLTYE